MKIRGTQMLSSAGIRRLLLPGKKGEQRKNTQCYLYNSIQVCAFLSALVYYFNSTVHNLPHFISQLCSEILEKVEKSQ